MVLNSVECLDRTIQNGRSNRNTVRVLGNTLKDGGIEKDASSFCFGLGSLSHCLGTLLICTVLCKLILVLHFSIRSTPMPCRFILMVSRNFHHACSSVVAFKPSSMCLGRHNRRSHRAHHWTPCASSAPTARRIRCYWQRRRGELDRRVGRRGLGRRFVGNAKREFEMGYRVAIHQEMQCNNLRFCALGMLHRSTAKRSSGSSSSEIKCSLCHLFRRSVCMHQMQSKPQILALDTILETRARLGQSIQSTRPARPTRSIRSHRRTRWHGSDQGWSLFERQSSVEMRRIVKLHGSRGRRESSGRPAMT